MIKNITSIGLACLTLILSSVSFASISPSSAVPSDTTLTKEQTYDIGLKAYIYAFPLVLMDVTRLVSTNVPSPIEAGTRFQAPINQFANMRMFPTADFKDVLRPNTDTLYTSAWLDLSQEPIILSVPDTDKRYYLMPMLSGWTDIFASPGKRTTGTKSGNFAIVGPYWKGDLPRDVKEIKSPTNLVWILGRIQTNGTSDYANVNQLQNAFKLTPLSAWNKSYTPPKNIFIDTTIDMITPPVQQVINMDALKFFKRFAELLKNNPPYQQDSDMLADLKKIGIEPGMNFNINSLTFEQIKALNQAVEEAQKLIVAKVKTIGVQKNGWDFAPTQGKYGTNYLERAAISYAGLGANLTQDAIFPTAFVDNDGVPLDGHNRYVIHFDRNQLPPTNAFWSIAMYDKDSFFAANPINRYSIGNRDLLMYNKDGSLDIYIQHEVPERVEEGNWLPAPAGEFNLTMRLYWPRTSAVEGNWTPPGIQRIPY